MRIRGGGKGVPGTNMDDFTLARAVHVFAVVMWIGGVAFVTTVLFPAIRRHHTPRERIIAFHRFERRFAWQARIWVALAGISGFWMSWRANLWYRFADHQYWWMQAMLALWLFFALMLFVFEPFILHRRPLDVGDPARTFSRMHVMHWILLILSMITILGAVAGSHGMI